MRTATPRQIVKACENTTASPNPRRETFQGYGVMGLPFESGHVLGLRRFPTSSIGPGYTSIWHRTPEGHWSFWSTTAGEVSCARYAGEISEDTHQTAIHLAWPEPNRLAIAAENPELGWEVTLAATPTSRALGALARSAPHRLLANDYFLKLLGPIAGTLLGTGRLTLVGKMPNRQHFHLVPTHVWRVTASCAQLRGVDIGQPARLPVQATIGDFRIPQHGLLAVGSLDFEVLNPAWHSTRTVRPLTTGVGAEPPNGGRL
jgi:hypothetical protein